MEKQFIWSEEYSVRNSVIDEQHQIFFGIANDLIDVVTDGTTDKAVVLEKVSKLGDYAMFHFATEEEMFEKYGYPEAPEHISAHNVFRDEAKRLIDDVNNGEGDAIREAEQAAEFAGNWLMNHIQIMDKKYSQFFIDQGLN